MEVGGFSKMTLHGPSFRTITLVTVEAKCIVSGVSQSDIQRMKEPFDSPSLHTVATTASYSLSVTLLAANAHGVLVTDPSQTWPCTK